MILCIVIALICGGFIGKYYYNLWNEKKQADAIVTEIEEKVEGTVPNDHMFDEWYNRNNDYLGWIKWDSGIIDTYLLKTDENNTEYYLHHDIDGNYALGGSAIIDYFNNVNDDNVIIYGHSVFTSYSTTEDLMFSPLRDMVSQEYFEANKTFKIYWQNSVKEYEVFAVCDVDAYNEEWDYKTTTFENSEREEWINKAKEISSVVSDKQIEESKQLITLQTCKYWQSSERIVVVAVEI